MKESYISNKSKKAPIEDYKIFDLIEKIGLNKNGNSAELTKSLNYKVGDFESLNFDSDNEIEQFIKRCIEEKRESRIEVG